VPAGKRLKIRAAGEQLEMVLVDAPEVGCEAPALVPVPVSTRIGRDHACAPAPRTNCLLLTTWEEEELLGVAGLR
jgi:hypothetical protein